MKLFNHQKHILELLTENDAFMVLCEQGTGKTLPTLIHLSNLYLSGEIKDALIIAPKSGLGAWERDTDKLSPTRAKLIRENTTLINYDKLSRTKSKWREMCNKEWGCVILDEGHAIAKPTSNRTQYIIGKGKFSGLNARAKYRYILTGTLITNGRYEDMWSPLRFINPAYMTYNEFKVRYLKTFQLPQTYVDIVVGYKHVDELLSQVANISFRVTKDDCLDLPEQLPDEVIKVPWSDKKNALPFSKKTYPLYAEALDSYIEAIDLISDIPLTRLLRMREIATGHIKESDTLNAQGKKVKGQTYLLNSDKPAYCLELIENNLPNKTVIFYHFQASCDVMAQLLTKNKISFVILNGAQKDKNIWRKFQEDESIKVIIVQYQSGSSAIDLFASSFTIFYEPTDSSTILEQARSRTHRNGQNHPCNYVFLIAENSIEEDMYKRLSSYEDFNEKTYREVVRRRNNEQN